MTKIPKISLIILLSFSCEQICAKDNKPIHFDDKEKLPVNIEVAIKRAEKKISKASELIKKQSEQKTENNVINFNYNEPSPVTLYPLIKRQCGCSPSNIGRASGFSDCPGLVTSAFQTAITSVDLDETADPMFDIDASGTYYLASDIAPEPATGNQTFIRISTSNVALNMNSKTITQRGSNGGNIALEIIEGVSNINIFNGVVNDILGRGIVVNDANSTDQPSNINLAGILVNNCDVLGIDINNASNVRMSRVTVTNCNGTGAGAPGAIGVDLLSVEGMQIDNSSFGNNKTNSATLDGIGIRAINCTSLNFINCDASGNQGQNGFGYLLTSTCVSCTFDFCSASANAVGDSGDQDAAGFAFNATSCTSLTNCLSDSNTATTTSARHAYGFKFENADGTKMNCCNALCNKATNTVFGFSFTRLATPATASNQGNACVGCISQNNESTGTTSNANAYGFFSDSGSGNSFENSTARNNILTATTALNSVGAGFCFRGTLASEQSSTIACCLSETNGPTGTTHGRGFGIKFGNQGDSDIIECFVDTNKLIGNRKGTGTLNTQTRHYGFRDFSSDMTSLLKNNIAFGQGKIFPLGPGQVIIDNGERNYMFVLAEAPGETPRNMITETDVSTLTTIDTAGPWNNISIFSE